MSGRRYQIDSPTLGRIRRWGLMLRLREAVRACREAGAPELGELLWLVVTLWREGLGGRVREALAEVAAEERAVLEKAERDRAERDVESTGRFVDWWARRHPEDEEPPEAEDEEGGTR